ncbi:MAG TPA: hypothetical protein VLO30_00355 [Chthoniobacterales bacterium]|nr:hypothetical protein [Chthoniobacterales bacterium]
MASDELKRALVCALAICALSAGVARGQGGPPMITDDPGTPGDRKWEINVAFAFEHRRNETSLDSPGIDLNYGVGESIQLTLQAGPVLLKRNGNGVAGGLGATEAAVKWRFLDEEKSGVDASMFPRIIFNITQSSVRRGLAEDGTRFQIPFQAAKKFGHFHADAELGPLASTIGRSEWLYGIVTGLEVSKTTMLMAELHGTSRMNFTRAALAVNVGLRQEFTDTRILIASLGHEIRDPDQSLALIGYLGVQLLF